MIMKIQRRNVNLAILVVFTTIFPTSQNGVTIKQRICGDAKSTERFSSMLTTAQKKNPYFYLRNNIVAMGSDMWGSISPGDPLITTLFKMYPSPFTQPEATILTKMQQYVIAILNKSTWFDECNHFLNIFHATTNEILKFQKHMGWVNSSSLRTATTGNQCIFTCPVGEDLIICTFKIAFTIGLRLIALLQTHEADTDKFKVELRKIGLVAYDVLKRISVPRIVSAYDVPFMVSLQCDGVHFCSGAILASRSIITANICLTKCKQVQNITVHLVNKKYLYSAGYNVTKVIKQVEIMNGSNLEFDLNNMALLKLREKIIFDKTVMVIPFGTNKSDPAVNNLFPQISFGLTFGWGTLTEKTKTANFEGLKLHQGMTTVLPFQHCPATLKQYMKHDDLCTPDDHCHGDYGTPLVFGELLYGILTFNTNCENKSDNTDYIPTYSVFSNIINFSEWFKVNIEADEYKNSSFVNYSKK